MAPSLARLVLLGAGLAILVSSFAPGTFAPALAALAIGLFPAALMALAEPARPRIRGWIAALAGTLATGLWVAVFWHDSPRVAGLPLATWSSWLLLAVVPFALVVYGVVVRAPERR